MIKTSCKECIFARYDDNIQISCYADRLDKFLDKSFVTAENNKTHFIINRYCNLCHQQNWADHYGVTTPEEQLELALSQAWPKVNFIVIIDKNTKPKQILKTVNSIISQKYESINIYNIDSNLIFEQIQEIMPENTKFSFHIGHLSGLLPKLKGYYCFIKGGSKVKPTLLKYLNNKINVKLEQIISVSDNACVLVLDVYFQLLPQKFTLKDENDNISEYKKYETIDIQDFNKLDHMLQLYAKLHSNNTKS